MCAMPFLQNPRRYASSGLAFAVHVALSGAVWALFWAADHGQFENLDAAARSVLEDDENS